MERIIAILGAGTAVAGLIFGVVQYTIAQRWRRTEAAAKQMQRLTEQEELHACCKILDWYLCPVVIPERYRPIYGKDETFKHHWSKVSDAMRPETEKGDFTLEEKFYRDLFDEFFGFLEETENFIQIGYLQQEDVKGLEYWLEQIEAPRHGGGEPIFRGFIEYYGYDGVIGLMQRFGYAKGWKARD